MRFLKGFFKFVRRQADTTTIHYSLFIIHFLHPYRVHQQAKRQPKAAFFLFKSTHQDTASVRTEVNLSEYFLISGKACADCAELVHIVVDSLPAFTAVC